MRSLIQDIKKIIGRIIKTAYNFIVAVLIISLIAYALRGQLPELYALLARFYGIFH